MRINQIIRLIKPNSIVIDVGSDHAKVAIKLLTNKIATFVYNIEINQGPLDNTINSLEKYGLLDNAKNILNDGLKNLTIKEKINYCVIAGMGGKNIIDILTNKSKDLNIENFILVPNNNAQLLRKFLKDNKFKVVYEEIISESGHYYELIQTSLKKGLKIKTTEDEYFGPYNLKNETKLFVEYQKDKWEHLSKNKNLTRNKNKLAELKILARYK